MMQLSLTDREKRELKVQAALKGVSPTELVRRWLTSLPPLCFTPEEQLARAIAKEQEQGQA